MQITLPTPTWEGAFVVIKSIGDWLLNLYHNGPKWMAWAGAGILILIYFGLFSAPTFSAKDSALEKQVAELSRKLDMLSSDINGVSIKVDTLKDMGGVPAKKSRK
jgi:hypothetical protein